MNAVEIEEAVSKLAESRFDAEAFYIGRRFKNDTERLEKLFGLYTQMTAGQVPQKQREPKKPSGRKSKRG
jgi:hypothetical protein